MVWIIIDTEYTSWKGSQEKICNTILSLPIYSSLKDEEINYVINVLNKYIQKNIH